MTKLLCNYARTVAYFHPFLACNIILANAGFEFEYIISSYETIPFSISIRFFLSYLESIRSSYCNTQIIYFENSFFFSVASPGGLHVTFV